MYLARISHLPNFHYLFQLSPCCYDIFSIAVVTCLVSIMTSTSTDGPVYKINPSHYFYALVSCLSHLEKTTHNIKTKLIPNQLALFRKTKFGYFLDQNIVFNGPLIHYLLLREVEDEGKDYISFLLGGIVCTFGRREFNIITGL
ncbi:hypothetical protein IC575_008225 [Cucumis melo]